MPHVSALHRLPSLALAFTLLAVAPAAAQEPAAPPAAPAPPPFTVLLTNDDGFEAPGLQALVKAFAGIGEVYVSAPGVNQSGAGHSVTLADAVVVTDRTLDAVAKAVSVDGSPATAARVGLERIVPRVPDLVVSGINRGENLGMSVYLSGTLGAAREAAFAGVPAIAVSIMGNRPETYAAAATATRALVDDLRARQLLKAGLFVNVNVPAGPVKGTKLARLSLRASRVEHQCSPPMRERVACFPVFRQTLKDEPGTDIGEFYQGFITVTPMALDVTDTAAMAAITFVEAAK